jgi:hypothetical protein
MVNETESSNRRSVIYLAAGALLLVLVAGVLIVTLVLGRGDSDEAGTTAESAKLMPGDSIMFASFNPHLDQAKNFEVIEKIWGDNPLIEDELTKMLSSMKEEGLDYKADIQPWLGDEVAFSIGADVTAGMSKALSGGLDQPPSLDTLPELPQMVMAVATTDKAASDSFLNKLRTETEKDGTAWQETEYKDIKIAYFEPELEDDVGAAYATIGDFVVLAAGGLESMQAMIDVRDGTSLSESENYQDVMAKLPSDQIGYGYIDVGVFMDAGLEAAGPALDDLPSDLISPEQLTAVKGIGFSVGLESNGLRFGYVAVFDTDALPESVLAAQDNSNKAAEHAPASTLFYLSGSGLGDLIQTGLNAVKTMPDMAEDLDEQLEMATAMLGVSVDELIQMLSGEFAMVVTHDPAGIGGDASMPVGASFLLEAKDEEKFQRLINSVSGLLGLLGTDIEFPKVTINDVEVMTIQDPFGGNMLAGWGVGKGFFAIGTSKGLLEAAFGGGGETLANAAIYKSAVAPLPQENSGVFFVNLEGLLQIAGEAMGPKERASFEEARSLLDPIKAISAAIESLDKSEDSVSGTFFVLIESE